ncbi:MAG: hypothetical protein EXX96DRAFT_492122 [Benjaminiella poitrasii]|nr:MAG: hypothetical protein EXX96DRAFT_492122 [Benjaminiella poitrasii]
MAVPHKQSTVDESGSNEESLLQTNEVQKNQNTIVLICNLDPRATAEDVGEACSIFGPILSCDMLLDPMGRPLNEAEIEFMYPESAKECVAKLDNQLADGRILRARVQSSATLPVKPRYSSRQVSTSARLATGGGFHETR